MHTHPQNHRGMGFQKIQGLSLGLLMAGLSLSLAAIGCQGSSEPTAQPRPQVSGVTLSVVTPTDLEEVFEATGTVRSQRTSVIASRVMGVITSLKVREGDAVKAGQLLLTLDDRDAVEREKAAAMAMESARQNRDLAEITWRRYQNLYKQKALSEQEMDQVASQRKVAQAEYSRATAMAAEARTNLGYTRITAPTAGRVTVKHVDAGSLASPGMPLLVLESGDDSIVEVAVDESLTTKIKTGQPVTITVDALSISLPGTIKEILPTIDAGSRTFTVKIAVQDARLKSGLFARAQIPLGKRLVLLVPENAIVQKGALTGVYVVDPTGVISYRLIRTGSRSKTGIEVLSGLKSQERIVTGGVDKAVDGGMLAKGSGA